MKRSMNLLGVILFLCFLVMVAAGCTKKTPITEEAIFVTKEKQVAAEQPAGVVKKTKPMAAQEEKQAQPVPPPSLKEEPQQWLQRELAKEQTATTEFAAKEPKVETTMPVVPSKSAVEFEDSRFAYDRYDLSPEARNILKRHADWLLAHKNYDVLIEGHCDERGTTEYNLALGQRRAAEAMKFLVDLGIDAARIKTISYGEELPLDPSHNEEAWAKNRRVHFVLTLQKK